jgi:hypothetical protein
VARVTKVVVWEAVEADLDVAGFLNPAEFKQWVEDHAGRLSNGRQGVSVSKVAIESVTTTVAEEIPD